MVLDLFLYFEIVIFNSTQAKVRSPCPEFTKTFATFLSWPFRFLSTGLLRFYYELVLQRYRNLVVLLLSFVC